MSKKLYQSYSNENLWDVDDFAWETLHANQANRSFEFQNRLRTDKGKVREKFDSIASLETDEKSTGERKLVECMSESDSESLNSSRDHWILAIVRQAVVHKNSSFHISN